MNEAKSELRAALKQKRLELTDAEHTNKSRAIAERLKQAADWSQVKTLHYFEPLLHKLEPDTAEFLNYIEDNFPDIKLFTPRKIGDEWDLVAAKGGEIPQEFDAVIVPMLGFDPVSLHRIGYGGGYYDEFLSTQPNAQKIGVCFELGKTPNLPTEPHDIPVNAVITESNSYPSNS